MTDRRYSDEEIAAIFRLATEEPQALPVRAAQEGLTLAELQEIGREIGIPADVVQRAAGLMDLQGRATTRKVLGFPIGVERALVLDRRLGEDEWERLVVELRETFQAKGVVRASGSLREWSNGNLHVLLEPAGAGHRLRMRTIKGSAQAALTGGVAMIGGAAVVAIAGAVSGGLDASIRGIVVMALAGAGMIGAAAVQLPAWARLRARQMESLGPKLVGQLEPPKTRDLPPTD